LTLLHPKILQLSKLGLFAHHKEVFEKMSRFFQIHQYKAGSLIHEEKKMMNKVFWLIEGELRISQKIGIVSCKKVLRPYIEDEDLASDEHLVTLNLETNRISPGAWYPKLPPIGSDSELVRYLGPEYLDNGVYREHFLDKVVELRVPYTIYAEKDSIIASISFAEIGQMALLMPKDVLYELAYLPMVHGFNTRELQEQYLSQVTWDMHKKRETDEFKKSQQKKTDQIYDGI
jgi:hypothetical protein